MNPELQPLNRAERRRLKRVSGGRECDDCSACCYVFAVGGVTKSYENCPHCPSGKGGCQIYKKRPPLCRGYGCLWLCGEGGVEDRPDKVGLIISIQTEQTSYGLVPYLQLKPTNDHPKWSTKNLKAWEKMAKNLGIPIEVGTAPNPNAKSLWAFPQNLRPSLQNAEGLKALKSFASQFGMKIQVQTA